LIASGSPNSRNAASNSPRASRYDSCLTIRQRSRYRLNASVIVNGSQRLPSPVRNHPLKSAHHRRFGPSSPGGNAVVTPRGAQRRFRRRRRGTTNPERLSIWPTVLAAGQSISSPQL
jgi:hypothetical protein